MKKLSFISIALLSHQEKKARKITFHPKRNLIIGKNHSGKSSVIKNIYTTLGAKPKGRLVNWDENAVTILDFKVDEEHYRIYHQSGNRACFNKKGELLFSASDAKSWSKYFAGITGFNLKINNKKQEMILADPSCFFIPFYMDQDSSWSGEWKTFPSTNQFSRPMKSILEYFTGVKPAKYYEVNSKKMIAESIQKDKKKEIDFLNRAKERLSKTLPVNGPKLNEANFIAEIEELSKRVNNLSKKQQDIKEKYVKQKNILYSISLQIEQSNAALKSFDEDISYLENHNDGILECPTCGAEDKDLFMSVLAYAEDSRILKELIHDLKKDYEKVLAEKLDTEQKLSSLNDDYKKVNMILSEKKENLQLKDIVESAGAEKAIEAFNYEHKLLKEEVDKQTILIDEYTDDLKKFSNKGRSTEILTAFREGYSRARISLNMPTIDVRRLRLESRPDLSGSGGPRAILAYSSSIWKVSYGKYGSFKIPIVIDSPNQKAQDDLNLPKVMEFISGKLPADAQVIVGSEEDSNSEYEKKIRLDEPYALLKENSYDSILGDVKKLSNELLKDVMSKK